MAERKRKIVIIKEGFAAREVAEESVAKTVKSAHVEDAVSLMATDYEPDETAVLSNEDLGYVFAELTDAEASRLTGKPGVEAVEDDKPVFALQDPEGGPELDEPEDEPMFDAEPAPEDLEAAREIDEAMSVYEDAAPEDFEIVTPEAAALATQNEPIVDDFDIDETGQIVSLSESAAGAVEAAGVPRERLAGLVKCIIKCALEELGGKTTDIPDEKISELLAGAGLSGSGATVQAVRDYITCGLNITYVPYAWRYSLGAGVRVAVVDTGIAARHPDLRVWGGVSYVSGVGSWNDDHYHGTHVAGTIAAIANGRGVVGVAPSARLYAVKVLDRNGRGYTSWILNGLAWCLRARMHVVNLSLGSTATTHDPRVYSRAYESAGLRLRRSGILPVAAAGNSGTTSRPYVGDPARCPSFMAVSAIDCRRRRASFSSYGPQVEICAPGVSVWSTVPPNGYRQLSGTSMASPHVAGVAALVKARRPVWGGDSIRVHLWRTALDLGAAGRDWFYGYGQVRAYHAVR